MKEGTTDTSIPVESAKLVEPVKCTEVEKPTELTETGNSDLSTKPAEQERSQDPSNLSNPVEQSEVHASPAPLESKDTHNVDTTINSEMKQRNIDENTNNKTLKRKRPTHFVFPKTEVAKNEENHFVDPEVWICILNNIDG